jgi:hypothetical protein
MRISDRSGEGDPRRECGVVMTSASKAFNLADGSLCRPIRNSEGAVADARTT